MEDPGNLRDIAIGQRRIIYLILVSLLISIPLLAFQSSIPQSRTILNVIGWGVSVTGAFFLYDLATSLNLKSPWLWIVGSFVPILNYVLLMIMNQKATVRLRKGGISVGFFGARNIEGIKE